MNAAKTLLALIPLALAASLLPASAAAQVTFGVQVGTPVYPAAPVYQTAPVIQVPQVYQTYPAYPVYQAPVYQTAPGYYPQQNVYPQPNVYPGQVGVVVGGQQQPHLNNYQKRALDNCALLPPGQQGRCRADVWSTVR